MAYRQILNMFGRKSLLKPVHVPDFDLMVGDAENLSSQPIILYEQAMPKQTYNALPNLSEMTYEEVQQDLASGKLSIDDFFLNTSTIQDAIVSE